MKKIRTIEQVSKCMGFSQETYRKNYNKIIKRLSVEMKPII